MKLKESEKNFITKSCLMSYKNSWEAMSIEKQHYFENFRSIFLALLEKEKFLILYNEEENSSLIKAFALYSVKDETPSCLHFIYVTNIQRNKGLASSLLRKAGFTQSGITTSFATKHFFDAFKNKYYIQYKPFLRYV